MIPETVLMLRRMRDTSEFDQLCKQGESKMQVTAISNKLFQTTSKIKTV